MVRLLIFIFAFLPTYLLGCTIRLSLDFGDFPPRYLPSKNSPTEAEQ